MNKIEYPHGYFDGGGEGPRDNWYTERETRLLEDLACVWESDEKCVSLVREYAAEVRAATIAELGNIKEVDLRAV